MTPEHTKKKKIRTSWNKGRDILTPEHTKQCEIMGEVIHTKIQDCVDDLKSHIIDEEKKVNTIHDDIKIIKENHLAHIQTDITRLATNQEWLMKTYWIVAGSGIGGLIAGIFNLMK